MMTETGFYLISDRRLKKNVTSLPLRSSTNFSKLRPVQYEWQSTEEEKKGVRFGFIAQEVHGLYPELTKLTGEKTLVFIREKVHCEVHPNNMLSIHVKCELEIPFSVGEELVLIGSNNESDEIYCRIKKVIFNDDDTSVLFINNESGIFIEDQRFAFLKARVVHSPLTVNYEEFVPVLVDYTQKLEKRVAMLEKIIEEKLK